MLKELRRGWVLGSEEFRDRMSNLASGIVRAASENPTQARKCAGTMKPRPVNCSRADSIA
jgi:hypothetical protein